MKRVLLLVTVGVLVLAAAVYSRQQPTDGAAPANAGTTQLKITLEEKNPWTHLKLNNPADQFQFVVISDRTGGHRAKIFSQAVNQINLLQPEFVMSVGDLIEGYSTKQERIDSDWAEFDRYIKKLEMPFFYVPGNHDLTNPEQVKDWGGRYGRKYYHFIFKNVLFLAINSEDPTSKVSDEQVAYFKKVIEENPNVRWTLGFVHKPMWTAPDLDKNGWGAMEKLLAGRKYTVFCGHVHRYQKFVRNGMNYYQLATTGGGSRLRGVKFGEFDHVAWITMKNDGPLIANVMLEGVLPENLQLADSDEKGVARKQLPTVAFKGKVLLDGAPTTNATVRFYTKGMTEGTFNLVSEGLTESDGTCLMSTYKGFDGTPAGEYIVTIAQYADPSAETAKPKNLFPEKYAAPKTTPLIVKVTEGGRNELTWDLMK